MESRERMTGFRSDEFLEACERLAEGAWINTGRSRRYRAARTTEPAYQSRKRLKGGLAVHLQAKGIGCIQRRQRPVQIVEFLAEGGDERHAFKLRWRWRLKPYSCFGRPSVKRKDSACRRFETDHIRCRRFGWFAETTAKNLLGNGNRQGHSAASSSRSSTGASASASRASSRTAAGSGGGSEARLQPVAQRHQFIDLGDDAVLFGEGWKGNENVLRAVPIHLHSPGRSCFFDAGHVSCVRREGENHCSKFTYRDEANELQDRSRSVRLEPGKILLAVDPVLP